MTVSIWVPGRPAPQGSKKHVGRGIMVESSKALKPWRLTIVDHVIAGSSPAVRALWPMQGPVVVRLAFVMPRPVSTPKRVTPPAIKKPDGDKLERGVWDALSMAKVWADDSQVTKWFGSKRIAEIGETPGVQIDVWLAGSMQVAA